jgi:hypothetical protein
MGSINGPKSEERFKMEKLFYLQDSRSLTGGNAMFWRANGKGYGTNLDELEAYTLVDAQQHHNDRNSDVPLLKSLVDERSVLAVDCQVLPEENTYDENDEYVVQVNGYWNGNDILFVGRAGNSYEYGRAGVFGKAAIEARFSDVKRYAVFAKSALDEVARHTFQAENIDKRLMCTKPGIKLVRPKRARPTTGKTRGNCPACGRITWNHNPYEDAHCVRCW